jgi:phenylacetic acid degradation protein
MPIYSFDGLVPVVAEGAFVHPDAVLIGDVWVAADCYVGPCASLRGDFGRIILAAGSNVQDNCTLHGFPGSDCALEQNAHIGHGAVLHGCRIGRNALIGMNSVVMDDAIVGTDAIVGAMSFIRSRQVIGDGMLAVGNPARIVRPLAGSEISWKVEGTNEYHKLARLSLSSLKQVAPLLRADFDRPRRLSDYQPFYRREQLPEN